MKETHIVVVGGGASGLIAAITAAKKGAKVTLIEQKEQLGKKILSTGNGRCNLTNQYMNINCFRGDNTAIVSEILSQFGYKDTITFFEALGIVLKDRQGYVYPITDQATSIVELLTIEVESCGVNVVLGQSVVSIERNTSGFKVQTTDTTISCDVVILATGGKAASVLGSDGSGYTLATRFGHHLSPIVPALVQLKGRGGIFKHVAGVRTQAKVSLYVDGKLEGEDIGELQLTNYGISGIPVFQISRFAAKGLYEQKEVVAELDFLPSMSESEFKTFILNQMEQHKERRAEAFLAGIFPKKLGLMLLKIARISSDQCIGDVEETKIKLFCRLCKHFKVDIEATNGFEQAQGCAGGIKTDEINHQTLESLIIENLYLTGELLDIDGICGGYNLQWAWSTGYIAGKNAAKG